MADALAAILQAPVDAGMLPSAQAEVRRSGDVLHRSEHGPDGGGIFDVASVTKIVATTASVMALVDDGALDLDAPLEEALAGTAYGDRTVRQLRGHRAGLVAWEPWFEAGAGPLDAVLSTPPERPADEARVYSDQGFITLGAVVEATSGVPFAAFARDRIWAPLGMADTSFHRLPGTYDAAPTGVLRPREPAPGQEGLYVVPPQEPRVVPGEVDDDNAWALGGVAGHAGVFSTASDLATFGEALLGARLWSSATVETFFAPDGALAPVRGLGFDCLARPESSCGPRFGQGERGAVGHLGFTGTSLWIDLDRDVVAVLLTNRTYPSRTNNVTVGPLRIAFHDAIVDLL